MKYGKFLIKLLAAIMLCQSTLIFAQGPPPSSQYDDLTGAQQQRSIQINTTTRLNVVIPVFDPNIPEDADDYDKEGVWPELRRAEANLFAVRTKEALESQDIFGSVRVTPNDYSIGDLYVYGEILQSTSEIVEIRIIVKDITKGFWSKSPRNGRTFEYRVRENDLENIRTQDFDPYQPVYEEIANYLATLLAKAKEDDLIALQNTASIVFARSFAENEFSPYFSDRRRDRNKNVLVSMPAEGDAKYSILQEIYAKDQLFIDDFQEHYHQFSGRMQASYGLWQEQMFPYAKAYREARRERVNSIIGTIIAVTIADQAGSEVVQAGAAVLAVSEVISVFKDTEELKEHTEIIEELGDSIDVTLAPQVVAFEGKTAELTGTASEQFQQWRGFLVQMYAEESTPNIQL